jgi:hypothetical protein
MRSHPVLSIDLVCCGIDRPTDGDEKGQQETDAVSSSSCISYLLLAAGARKR